MPSQRDPSSTDRQDQGLPGIHVLAVVAMADHRCQRLLGDHVRNNDVVGGRDEVELQRGGCATSRLRLERVTVLRFFSNQAQSRLLIGKQV